MNFINEYMYFLFKALYIAISYAIFSHMYFSVIRKYEFSYNDVWLSVRYRETERLLQKHKDGYNLLNLKYWVT